jgi:hypothetical protein
LGYNVVGEKEERKEDENHRNKDINDLIGI